jgi:hypothetical protein
MLRRRGDHALQEGNRRNENDFSRGARGFRPSGCVTAEEMAARNASADDSSCQSYGAAPGSSAYFTCRMTKDQPVLTCRKFKPRRRKRTSTAVYARSRIRPIPAAPSTGDAKSLERNLTDEDPAACRCARLEPRRPKAELRSVTNGLPSRQCLHSAEADVRPPRSKSGFDPQRTPRETRGQSAAIVSVDQRLCG